MKERVNGANDEHKEKEQQEREEQIKGIGHTRV